MQKKQSMLSSEVKCGEGESAKPARYSNPHLTLYGTVRMLTAAGTRNAAEGNGANQNDPARRN